MMDEVFVCGSADRDGRLCPGDRTIKVCFGYSKQRVHYCYNCSDGVGLLVLMVLCADLPAELQSQDPFVLVTYDI